MPKRNSNMNIFDITNQNLFIPLEFVFIIIQESCRDEKVPSLTPAPNLQSHMTAKATHPAMWSRYFSI
jgi:hypothetical protein